MYINVEALPSPRLARVTFTCVCVCNTYVCVYIYVRRERALFFFDEREELNSRKFFPYMAIIELFARARRTTSAYHISNVYY